MTVAFLLAALPTRVVQTTNGPIEGLPAAGGVERFLGVPYARPPLRFAPPTPHSNWTEVRSAQAHGHCCVPGNQFGYLQGSEDCLVLDVYAPSKQADKPRPVLVWLYGGSFLAGCIKSYDATNLSATSGAIVVLVNYRLSVLGYLGLPELLSAGQPTNVGLLDMTMGLKWARDNALAFGGDPSRVSLFGQSAGGAAVSFQLTMPAAKGLFHAAILQSAGGRKGWVEDLKENDNDAMSAEEIAYNAEQLATSRGCGATPGAARLACLRNLSLAALLAEPFGRFAPGVDGISVNHVPLHAVRLGLWHRDVDVIVGSTSCESCAGEGMLIPPGKPRVMSQAEYTRALNQTFGAARFREPVDISPGAVARWYGDYKARRGVWQTLTRIASDNSHACNAHLLVRAFLASSNATVRRYEFRAAGGHPGQTYPGAVHASELEYIFRSGVPYQPSKLTPQQDALGAQMQRMWGEFAAGSLTDTTWPACTPSSVLGADIQHDIQRAWGSSKSLVLSPEQCDHVALLDTPTVTFGTEADVDDGSAVENCAHWDQFMR